MGLRFRKSIKLGGGSRINISKSGIGYSVGTKGARVTKKAGGGTRTTISAPGTGISYVQESGNTKKASSGSSGGGRSSSNSNGPKKRKTWLWVLGWLFIFPVPLTILMLRKKDMEPKRKYGIIAAGWIVYLLIGLIGGAGSSGEGTSKSRISNASEGVGNISEISFSKMNDVTLRIGETDNSGKVKVKVKRENEFSPEDVRFISDNPEIATIVYTKTAYATTLNYEITALSAGETTVFVASSDGSVSSEKVKVVVPQPVEVESISFSGVKNDLVLGESIQVTANVFPGKADNKRISWTSSDMSVASVNQTGSIVTVGGGSTIITATAPNGIAESFELNVDGTKRVMNLRVTHQRDDDNNIGDDWSYLTQVNGESAIGEYILSKGDTLSFYAEFTESDDNPDVGKASASYTVKEEDLMNGFNVSMDLYVKENGGRNSGKRAHFTVNYDFKAK